MDLTSSVFHKVGLKRANCKTKTILKLKREYSLMKCVMHVSHFSNSVIPFRVTKLNFESQTFITIKEIKKHGNRKRT